MDMRHENEQTAWTRTSSMGMDMQHGKDMAVYHARGNTVWAWTWTCSIHIDIQHGLGHEASTWTGIMDMKMDKHPGPRNAIKV
jgi:hypothetical protein